MNPYPLIHITFLDHSMGSPDDAKPYQCEVFGVLYKEDDRAYYLASWVCNGDISEHNNECYAILKSCVLKKRRLK